MTALIDNAGGRIDGQGLEDNRLVHDWLDRPTPRRTPTLHDEARAPGFGPGRNLEIQRATFRTAGTLAVDIDQAAWIGGCREEAGERACERAGELAGGRPPGPADRLQ